MKNKKIGSILAILVVCILGILLFEAKDHVHAIKNGDTSLAIPAPVIMVPGTNGDVDRFDSLVDSLKQTEKGVEEVKITVNKDDSITSSGHFTKETKRPIIAVAFEDGSDPSLPKQSRWFQQALAYAEKKYTFNTYDYLGYSNGGLIITGYLENEQKSDDPALYHLITLGTPYNDTSWEYNDNSNTFTKPKAKSELLNYYLKNKKNIPKNITVYNIAGNVDHQNTDTTVPLTSVLAGRLIYGNSEKYKEIIVEEQADHGSLIENPKTLKLIKEYLFESVK
ncbi:alpha/beta hydrolase [Enterococcus avium]|uniref:Alpha/beta hydrolase n=1 Tax=Enterococcus avium TaxID=33945 RepID=A0ABD5F5M4_ENTAV|nr:alpha/beta hydrolase [Enterococcus avium]MDT2398322.1 alpha/beta hydrolase [Enterococcus avium]MDT2436427.1 alpha/beta hydrolase [Enterococcus avium]MDT2448448.1 alpha/beta hydrolase [Enterococcus avium]MDT2464564.1 alpha/beta hydrolase [Enterococcus avium]MDT2481986.1 alpha/beta hydrolase [Enterococcus avium]